MSNETKRDVFDETVKRLYDSANYEGLDIDAEFRRKGTTVEWELQTRYVAALPDDLPVIPKVTGEWIKKCKMNNVTLENMLCTEMQPESVRWWISFKDGDIANGFDDEDYRYNQEMMAKAWVLGVWRVEETGEIVKLEEEK